MVAKVALVFRNPWFPLASKKVPTIRPASLIPKGWPPRVLGTSIVVKVTPSLRNPWGSEV